MRNRPREGPQLCLKRMDCSQTFARSKYSANAKSIPCTGEIHSSIQTTTVSDSRKVQYLCRIQSDQVIHSLAQLLLEAQVALGCLHGDMT